MQCTIFLPSVLVMALNLSFALRQLQYKNPNFRRRFRFLVNRFTTPEKAWIYQIFNFYVSRCQVWITNTPERIFEILLVNKGKVCFSSISRFLVNNIKANQPKKQETTIEGFGVDNIRLVSGFQYQFTNEMGAPDNLGFVLLVGIELRIELSDDLIINVSNAKQTSMYKAMLKLEMCCSLKTWVIRVALRIFCIEYFSA